MKQAFAYSLGRCSAASNHSALQLRGATAYPNHELRNGENDRYHSGVGGGLQWGTFAVRSAPNRSVRHVAVVCVRACIARPHIHVPGDARVSCAGSLVDAGARTRQKDGNTRVRASCAQGTRGEAATLHDTSTAAKAVTTARGELGSMHECVVAGLSQHTLSFYAKPPAKIAADALTDA